MARAVLAKMYMLNHLHMTNSLNRAKETATVRQCQESLDLIQMRIPVLDTHTTSLDICETADIIITAGFTGLPYKSDDYVGQLFNAEGVEPPFEFDV